jgi:hypothetical protein
MENDPPAHLAGKSTAYDYLKSAPDSAWAWEFARRNALIRAVLAAPARLTDAANRMQIVHGSPDTMASPIRWASSPDDNAASATVMWNPDTVPSVLRAVAVPARYGFGGATLDLAEIALRKTLFVADDGCQSLIIGGGMRSLQIAIAGAPITETVVLFVDTKLPKHHRARQLRLLECFRTLRATGALPDNCFPAHPHSTRNAFVLEALDGYLAGKSHRDIAIGLYGEARVDRDWPDPRENMRDVVRRAIARGISTMERGYLDFFRYGAGRRSR